ncbi:spore coat protein YsxE [Lederbergia lenta]|uniref:Spore coat protein YsxE n=1 Tax=Lederbergia lenta TaxID=1467 RepID=A0A2X4VZE8_LEDLE|nr:spore coat protein YsxE [Lederbergia lenta]MCM3111264.1 spore coat protein YsxE [Lederbergia lenta]MEC2325348.1 spore coat protein YsxE [Lederbergia lenta]SQI55789.1 spore coat protein YsxE [Lederbergia lenta]
MAHILEEEVKRIVKLYGLDADFVQNIGNVYRIYTNKGEFALKRMKVENGLDFLYYMQFLYQRGYNRIVPIFPTADGRFAILEGKYVYYLMPWLENKLKEDHTQKHHDLFRELARFHMLSVREVPVSKEERKEHFDRTQNRWEKEQEAMETYMEVSEKTWYMSPFQLMFCTFFSEISGGQRYALRKLNDWHEASLEETKARSVIVHGKLSTEHFLYNEKGIGYFSNFEKASIASPIHDLLPFLSRMLNTHPKQFNESVEWLEAYFRHFPFKSEEMHLFLSYLAQPGPIYRVIEKYFSTTNEKNEMQFVRDLQRHYWQMKNKEFIVMRLNEIEERKKQMEQEQSHPSE